MDHDTFWQLVDSTRGHSERVEQLVLLMEPSTTENIVRFRLLFDDLMDRANRVDLWGAANTLLGGCTEDGFFDFRESLIEMGREPFETSVNDPDSLADRFQPGEAIPATDGIINAAMLAWTTVTGQTEDAFFEAVDATDTRTDRGDAEEGEWWNFEDKEEVRHRLPRLAAKFVKSEE